MKKVLYVVLAVAALVLLAVPAFALEGMPPEPENTSYCLNVTIDPIADFSITPYFNDIVIEDESDFADNYNLGYITTFVSTNMPWQLWCHWENACDDGDGMAFPENWMIWYVSPNGPTPITTSENGQLLDEGDCEEAQYNYNFLLTGPNICDVPGLYQAEIEFFLGPA